MSAKNNESIKRTGDMLLSGWKLLNSACPICNTALLSKGELLRCPTCDLAVVKESDQQKYTNEQTNVPNPSKIAEAKFEIEDDYYQYATGVPAKFESLNEAKKLYDQQNKKMNQVSDKLGAKMLAGFSMLSTVCPNEECRGTPLCRQGSGPMVCVCCDSEFKVSSLGDLIPTLKTASASEAFNGKVTAASVQSVSAVSAPAATTPSFSAPARVNLVATADEILPASEADNAFFLNMQNAPILDLSSFARESENDCSSKIARKLMLGWALLDKCCAQKGCKGEVPLMRDLQGMERCVQCGFPDAAVPATTVGQAATTSGPSHQRPVLSSAARNRNQTRDSESEPENESESEAYDSESEEADMALFHQFRARQAATAATAASAAVKQNTQVKNKREMHSAPVQKPSMAQLGTGQTPGVKLPCFGSMGGDMESEVNDAVRVVKQKLSESALGLASAQNLDTQIKYAELIGKLATALKALQQVDC
uniref:Uncharacterized protein n=1 Tax=Spumella elongata TaxID=89044 RepID=A0A7S3M3I0_9STRA|mmetsp:Transcript_27900/g.47721  ORF Transcript_27900/g.47721 Transcript_27900/m.47721 type:complete len:481 (+) Transcript_27900:48-1490(+)